MKSNSSLPKTARIWRSWDKWECYRAGFYRASPPQGMEPEDCEAAYRDFLSDVWLFREAMIHVVEDWPNSCAHFLTNQSLNRIAWLGQSSMCWLTGVPSKFRSGFRLLTAEQQEAANSVAESVLVNYLTALQNALRNTSASGETETIPMAFQTKCRMS